MPARVEEKLKEGWHSSLADPSVIAALSGYTRVKVQAEDLDASPAREVMGRARVGTKT